MLVNCRPFFDALHRNGPDITPEAAVELALVAGCANHHKQLHAGTLSLSWPTECGLYLTVVSMGFGFHLCHCLCGLAYINDPARARSATASVRV